MNMKICSALATVMLAGSVFAQAPASAPSVSPDAIDDDLSQVVNPVSGTQPEARAETVAQPEAKAPVADQSSAPQAAPEASSEATPVAKSESEEDASAPVAVRDGKTDTQGTDAPNVTAPSQTEENAIPALNAASAEEENAPKAVRGGATDASKPATTKKVVYERVYMGPDGIPVRTLYVAEEPSDGQSLNPAEDRFPMKFKIGATASVNSYYLSNDDYDQYGNWYGESFSGFSWRAGVMALFPLNPSIGIKVGALYEQSSASERYYVEKVATQYSFEQKKMDVPVLFTFKAFGSRLFFDLGAHVSIPLQDELEVSYTDPDTEKKVKRKTDLMDDYRNTLDWSVVFGFSIMANQYISLDLHADIGLSEAYDGTTEDLDLGLSSSSFGIGLTVYPF